MHEPQQDLFKALAASIPYRNADGSCNRLMPNEPDKIMENEINMLAVRSEQQGLKSVSNIDELLGLAWSSHASDVHLSAGAPPKFRIFGELRAVPGYAIMTPNEIKAILEPILSDAQRAQYYEDGDLDFAYSIRGVGRFRCNYYRQRGSWSAVFRLLADKIPSTDELGIPECVMDLTNRKRGLVLVTGPTGSGKSTTLAAMINAINVRDERNIITLEDPIEYTHKHARCNINQREGGSDTKSFAAALRAALRQDPDVILVGEMRDFETISIALTAAETGHLVFSTLHTLGAADTINRIVDTYPENQQSQARAQLSGCLEGIISQQLVPRRDKTGRVAAFEILFTNTAIRSHIRENQIEQIPNDMQTARTDGMISLDQSLHDLVSKGLVTEDQAIKFATNPRLFMEVSNHQGRIMIQNNMFGRK